MRRFGIITIQVIFFLLGIACIAIAFSHYFFGPEFVLNATQDLFARFGLPYEQIDSFGDPNVDSELRFYAVYFAAFGTLCLYVFRKPFMHRKLAIALMSVFFIGGIGRVLSYFAVGAPAPVMIALGSIEIIFPPIVLIIIWSLCRVDQ